MRAMGVTARLLAATAICLVASVPAYAQDNGLVSVDGTPIANPSGSTIEGDRTGIYSTGDELNLDNEGAIRGNGLFGSVFNSDGGIVINGGPAAITNSGEISGARFGITTIYYTNTDSSTEGRAIGSTIDNSGSIIGDSDDGIRLIGGGDVVNSGYIAGRLGAGADGVSMFSFDGQDLGSFAVIGSVTNLAGATIEGNRYGIILSNGGTVENAGTISGNTGAIHIQAQTFDPGRVGTVVNSGTLNGAVSTFGLASASITNSGSIVGTNSGILDTSQFLTVNNSGTIRGNGTNAFTSNTDAGIAFNGGPADITNSGTISGARFGVTSFYYSTDFSDPDNPVWDSRAIGSTLTNSGSIIGDSDDGVRFIGGGTVANSGYIAGRVGATADGVSMFAYTGQDTSGLTSIGTVNNLAGGTIEGNRFAIILSGGGTIYNAGTLNGGTNGATLIQAPSNAIGGIGTMTNSGTINGDVRFNDLTSAQLTNTGSITGAKSGILDASQSLTVDNSGTIRGNGTNAFTGNSDAGIAFKGGAADITNSGTISGARFGITSFYYFSDADNNVWDGRAIGSTLTNSGSIIGDGDDGVRFIGGGTVTNSGYIAGRVGGLADGVSMFAYNGQDTSGSTGIGTVTNLAGGVIEGNRFGVILSGGGRIDNAGTISGLTNSGVLIQGSGAGKVGTLINSGTINRGAQISFLDSASATNSGTITGVMNFFGIVDASLDNSGIITGTAGFTNITTASMTNSGSVDAFTYFNNVSAASLINGGELNDYVSFEGGGSGALDNGGSIFAANGVAVRGYNGGLTIANSGSITSANSWAIHGNIPTITNSETGAITGATSGIWSQGPAFSLTNFGSIRGNGGYDGFEAAPDGGVLFSGGPGTIANYGTISGQRFGITTAYNYNSQTQQLEGLTTGSLVENLGSIISDTDTAVRLIGGGTVTNSGHIAGALAGVTMFAFNGQDLSQVTGLGTVTNLEGGVIEGEQGILLADGGGVDNAGTINGSRNGVRITAWWNPGRTGTVTNSGTINGTVLLEGLSDAIVSNSGSILSGNDFGVNLLSGGSVTNSGQILGQVGIYMGWSSTSASSGSVTNLAGGTIVGQSASGDGIYLTNGGAVINAGTISTLAPYGRAVVINSVLYQGQSGAVSNSGSIEGGITLGGTLANATINNSGTISGAGIPAIYGNAATTLVNSGTISTTGSVAVLLSPFADSVTLQTGSSINGAVDGQGGTDSLTLAGTISTPTSLQTVGRFLNFETLNVLGGYWQATGNTGTLNSTTVAGGTLAVNGSITSPILVSPAARLGGTGTITGNVTVNGGAYLAPGNSIGTLSVTGDVSFGAGSVFQVETTPSGLADRLAVDGNVTIGSGASVQVLAGSITAEGYAANTIYTILTTTGSIAGKFGSVTTDLAFLKPVLAHKSKEILLTLARNGKPITSASTANTFGAASAVEGLGEGSPIYNAVLVQSFDGAQQAFSSLSGGALGDLNSLLAEDFGQLRLGLDSAPSSAPLLEWSGSNSLHAYGFHSGTVMSNGPISVMLAGGQQTGSLSTDDVSGEVLTRYVAGAVGYRSDRFQAMAGMTSGWHDVSVNRTISFPGFAEQAASHYSAASRRLQGEASYTLSRGRIGLAPYAAYSNLTIETPAFVEQGGVSALSFEKGVSSIDQLGLGVRMMSEFEFGNVKLAPRLDLSIRRTWSDGDLSASFARGSDQFDITSSHFDGRSGALDAGIDLRVGPVLVAGSYRGQLGEQWQDHRAVLGVSLPF